jgi:ATP-dependent helicase/DNAse subunit B
MPDKFAATWVSHSSISDFLKCPRAYFLKNVYKDPQTNHKIQIIGPALSLGSAVHEVVEELSTIPTETRFKRSLIERLDSVWSRFSGEKGGFSSAEQEHQYRERAEKMLRRVMDHPGPLTNRAVKIKEELPQYWISEPDNIILCGKIDWLEYLPDTDSVHIIDFKTSKSEENESSLQLPIYNLLVHNTQQRKVSKLSYWYLELSDNLVEKKLPDLEKSHELILGVAKKIKLARQLGVMKCPQGEKGCRECQPLERVIKGEAKFVGEDQRRDLYVLSYGSSEEKASEIL